MVSVYVSGASGFIAQHVVKQLIEKQYKVVGSVRTEEKGELLAKRFGPLFTFEVVKDISKTGSFDESLKKHPEVTVFLHTASPFFLNAVDVERELLEPAVEGTKNALSSIKNYGPQIKHVVITSSFAAVKNAAHDKDRDFVLTEESWNPITREEGLSNPGLGYLASKTFAEREAWDFVKENKPNFTLATINPTFVFGPQAFDDDIKDSLNTSAEVINNLLKLKQTDSIPESQSGYIDVRDVAKAHLTAFENKQLYNQRLVVFAGRYCSQMLIDIIHDKFPELSKQVPVGKPGTGQKFIKQFCGWNFKKTEEILGFKYITLEQCVVDSVEQILKARRSS